MIEKKIIMNLDPHLQSKATSVAENILVQYLTQQHIIAMALPAPLIHIFHSNLNHEVVCSAMRLDPGSEIAFTTVK